MIPVDDDYPHQNDQNVRRVSFSYHFNNQANGHGKYDRVNLLLLKNNAILGRVDLQHE